MEEITETKTPIKDNAKRKLLVRWSDVAIFAVILVVIVSLIAFIINRLDARHDAASAKIVADKVIADLGKRDGQSAYNLGSTKFKSTYTAAQLTQQFNAIQIVTSEKPTVDQQLISKGSAGKTVAIIYKYPKKLAQLPFYVAILVSKYNNTNTWQLTNISGSADESSLAP